MVYHMTFMPWAWPETPMGGLDLQLRLELTKARAGSRSAYELSKTTLDHILFQALGAKPSPPPPAATPPVLRCSFS